MQNDVDQLARLQYLGTATAATLLDDIRAVFAD
jgi:hypothetical protein